MTALAQLEKRVKVHRAFSESFKSQFSRLLGDELQPEDFKGIDDSTLCLSFMRLELTEAMLAQCRSASEARQELQFLLASVPKSRDLVFDALKNTAVSAGYVSEYDANVSLLAYEEAILKRVKEQAELGNNGLIQA